MRRPEVESKIVSCYRSDFDTRAIHDQPFLRFSPLIQEHSRAIDGRGATSLRQLPFGEILGKPPGKLPGALRVKAFAERESSALEFLLSGIDQRVENAVALFSGGSNRGEAIGDKCQVVNLAKVLADRLQFVV